jgi:hypothetical protein
MQSALVGSFRILKLEYARRIAPEWETARGDAMRSF